MSVTAILGLISLIVVLLTNFAIVVRMYIRVGDYEKWRESVDHHIADTEKHIDPRRDSERWAELTKRIDKIDKKLDNILVLERDHNIKRKGDSEDA